MRIIITGTPGVGKTQVSFALSKLLGIGRFPFKSFLKKKGLIEKGGLVDLSKVRKELMRHLPNSYIIESHLLSDFSIPADFVFVLRCPWKILLKRLKKRGYWKKKICENLLAEVLDYSLINAIENYGGNRVFEVYSDRGSPSSVAKSIIEIMNGKTYMGLKKEKKEKEDKLVSFIKEAKKIGCDRYL